MASTEMADGTLVLEPAAHGALSSELVHTVNEFCDRVADAPPGAVGVLRLRGADAAGEPPSWPGDGTSIRLVNRWERTLRRVERLGVVTVAVLTGR